MSSTIINLLYIAEPAMLQGFFCRQSGARTERCEPLDQCLEEFPILLIATEGPVPLPERERLARVLLSKAVLKDLKHLCPMIAMEMMQLTRRFPSPKTPKANSLASTLD
jgi:hypothetical protein